MSDRRLSNARIQSWLAPDLDHVAEQMDNPKAQINSAAVWWFCHRLGPEERARILGEFVAAAALRGNQDTAATGDPSPDGTPNAPSLDGTPNAPPPPRRRKPMGR